MAAIDASNAAAASESRCNTLQRAAGREVGLPESVGVLDEEAVLTASCTTASASPGLPDSSSLEGHLRERIRKPPAVGNPALDRDRLGQLPDRVFPAAQTA